MFTAICPPIFWATKHGHLKMVNLLLQSGARTERPHCLHGSPGKGSRHELYNQSISALPTVLQLALAQKDDSMAKTLLLHGADPEPAQINGSTGPFRHLHQKKILRIRLGNHRGDVYSSKLLSLLRKAQRWDRPLKVASFCEFLGAHVQPEGIRLRLDHGKPGTLSFLQAAAWKWDVPMMKKSLEKRGNINCVNSEGLTPLHMLFLNPWRFHSNSHSFKELQKALTFMVDNGAKFNSLKTPAPLILVIADAISHMEPQDGMELFDFLVNQGLTCDDPRALEKAVAHRCYWLLSALLEIRINNPHLQHPALIKAVTNADRSAVEILLQCKRSASLPCTMEALKKACLMVHNHAMIRLLIDLGVPTEKPNIKQDCMFLPPCGDYLWPHEGRVALTAVLAAKAGSSASTNLALSTDQRGWEQN
ncbi:uncharacterized protein J3D65DRAFT_103202 [Phyllosticta citribraziliensis]|uniref:Ankyrin repeat protein n=1 Tax=Phyllosticta citribraziliensis TaxID=989973 RepID=A0ABR1LAS2_9PEZI